MKKVYIETPIGDIIDKLTILEIKKKKISKKAHLAQINKEYSSLRNTLKKNVKTCVVGRDGRHSGKGFIKMIPIFWIYIGNFLS